MQKIVLCLLGAIVIVFSGCHSHKAAFSGTAWDRYQSPEDAGFSSDQLNTIAPYIKDQARTTGLVVIYDGKILYEYGDIEKISYIASCRKSVLSMLYGKPVEDGQVDLSRTIGSMGIDEKDGLLPVEKEATVYDIITSRSGVFHLASNGGYDKENFLDRGSVQPGEYFVYNNWDFNVGGELLEEFTGHSIYQELETQFAVPLGFQDWNIKNQKKSGNKRKSQYLAYHMYLSTRDMAKLGQLMLNSGNWQGQQLIPDEWVAKSTSTVTPHSTLVERWGEGSDDMPKMSYGYMWWLIDDFRANPAYEGAYSATGYGGQFITVIPQEKLVIAHKTKLKLFTMLGLSYKGTDDRVYYEIVDKVVNAKL